MTDQTPEGDLPELGIDTPAEVLTDRITAVDLQLEMQRSYLDYAMSVIVGRALPDVRDGLKPVHRRVLYAMYDGGYRPDRQFSKCSRVVGDVMGKYHPHGDTAIYDALVRLVQDWSLRYPLVAGQGNFGSPGNDPAAAPRYTECKMAHIAMEMVRDIDEETVDFRDNYDGRTQEPSVLPARFPNLLVNGSAGIAVGMATNIPPHNLRELTSAITHIIDHWGNLDEVTVDDLMQFVHGPDFPTAAIIVADEGLKEAYATGRGRVVVRAQAEIEEGKNGRFRIVVTEIPYQISKTAIIERINTTKGTTEYRLGEIYLSATPENQEQVFANARKILEQIQQGGSFTAYARQFSEASTAAVGGDQSVAAVVERPGVPRSSRSHGDPGRRRCPATR